jgi:hypothetical protein
MRSKLLLVAALFAALALPVTAANARGFGGGGHGFGGGGHGFGGHGFGGGGHFGGFGGGHVAFGGFRGGFGGWRGGFGGWRAGGLRIASFGFRRPFFFHRPFFFRRPFVYAGLYGGSCWRLVWTPWGFHRRWVCGYPYSYGPYWYY